MKKLISKTSIDNCEHNCDDYEVRIGEVNCDLKINEIISEISYQRYYLEQINNANIHCYLTARQVNELLKQICLNLSSLHDQLIELKK
jgi:hypothetical protein